MGVGTGGGSGKRTKDEGEKKGFLTRGSNEGRKQEKGRKGKTKVNGRKRKRTLNKSGGIRPSTEVLPWNVSPHPRGQAKQQKHDFDFFYLPEIKNNGQPGRTP